MASLTRTAVLVLVARLLPAAEAIPFPTGPAKLIDSVDGTAFPPYRTVFVRGECTANDFPKPEPINFGPVGSSTINTNKTCFSCFRIPTLLAGSTPGVVHAFAEARRGELTSGFHQYTGSGAESCPDGPDTRLAYKRSIDGGASWSPVKILMQNDKLRAENGAEQSQASPVIDPSTKTLFVGFNQGAAGTVGGLDVPHLINSTDDGVTWSEPYVVTLNLGGGKTQPADTRTGFGIGPTKGLVATSPAGGVRLMLPGEGGKFAGASIYSDDHGQTWHSNGTAAVGEMDWTVCPQAANCPAGMKYAMINRGGAKDSPNSCQISFSADSTTWSKQISTDNGQIVVGTHHGKPGLVAVPGALLSSQQISQCPLGLKLNPDSSCGTPGSSNHTNRTASDVIGHGMALLISKDGVHWSLFKKLWPYGGMYTTMAALTTNAAGEALTYGVIFANPASTITYMNFTAVHPNGTMNAELAAAIATLTSPASRNARAPLGVQHVGDKSVAAAPVSANIPFPTGPAPRIPSIDGTAFPPYRTVFVRGECTANDFPKPEPSPFGPTTINTNKTCFSCFRIPTLLAGSTPGVVHAFAEARRGELTSGFHQYTGSGAESCPDGPDTRLAYKRSIDGGASWSPVKIFLQPANERAENGHCQSQAAPLIDPTTKTLFVAFNSGGPMCQGRSTPMLVNSTDDGLHFSDPYPLVMTGSKTRSVSIGPTKGLTVPSPNGGMRLMMPGENGGAASIFSDDHGQHWVSNDTLSPGEMDWTVCPQAANCPAGMKYAMINRGGAKDSPNSCQISFSADSTTWSKQISTDNGQIVVGTHHGKPGLVAVPGALLSSQQISQCPLGLKLNPDSSCGTPGSSNHTNRTASDVIGHGMALLISKDGVHWSLFKKLWPYGGMYTTMAALTTNAAGEALTYGVIFSAGSADGGVGATGTVTYMNFTAVHSDGEVDADLVAAIARL